MSGGVPPTTFREITKRAAPAPRPRSSRWFITISSNKRYDSMTSAERASWEDAMRELLANPYFLLTMAPDARSHGLGEFLIPPPSLISSIEVEMAFERGPQTDKYHLHAIVTVVHTSSLRLNYTAISKILREVMGGSNQYFRAHTSNDSKLALQEYLAKFDGTLRYSVNPSG